MTSLDNKLTQEQLKALLNYDPRTGVFTWLVNKATAKKGDIAGNTTIAGYRSIGINNGQYLAHRLAWFYVTGSWPIHHIDHINHKRDDNRWKNLRVVSHQDNRKNSTLSKRNKSGVSGVSWNKREQRWRVTIGRNRKSIYLGCFESKTEAASIRKDAEIQCNYHPNHGKAPEK